MEMKQETLPGEEQRYSLDEEDKDDLLVDCYYFIEKMIGRSGNPKWATQEGAEMLKRLGEALQWEVMH